MSNETPGQLGLGSVINVRRIWWALLLSGLLSIVLGAMLVAWPGTTIIVVAVLVAIWLFIAGIYQIVRAFGSGLTGGTRALLLINGAISIFLALFAFRGFRLEDSPLNAVWLLAVIIGVAFSFRAIGALAMAVDTKDGRGWNIFTAVVMAIGGMILLIWPGITLPVFAWVSGIWLIVLGIFDVLGSFTLRAAASHVEFHQS